MNSNKEEKVNTSKLNCDINQTTLTKSISVILTFLSFFLNIPLF